MANVLKFPSSPPSGQAPADGERSKLLSQSKLTELRVEKLPVTGKTYYLNDAAQPGLSLRVSAGGVKAFVFTKFKHGKFIQITLGRANAVRLDAARRAAQKLHGELAQGIDILARRKAAGAAHTPSETMEQAFARFLTLKARRPTTLTDYHYLWKQHIPAGLKREAVANVTAVDIESAKRAVGKHHRTGNKVVALLSAILARSGRRMDNPAQETIRHAEHPRTRRLSIDELTKVWSAAEREPEWKDFFRLLILTGARRSPFCAMRWQDLDLDAGVWLVPVEWAKSKREMAIPLSIKALRILKARREAISADHEARDGFEPIASPECRERRVRQLPIPAFCTRPALLKQRRGHARNLDARCRGAADNGGRRGWIGNSEAIGNQSGLQLGVAVFGQEKEFIQLSPNEPARSATAKYLSTRKRLVNGDCRLPQHRRCDALDIRPQRVELDRVALCQVDRDGLQSFHV
jgi:integrase